MYFVFAFHNDCIFGGMRDFHGQFDDVSKAMSFAKKCLKKNDEVQIYDTVSHEIVLITDANLLGYPINLDSDDFLGKSNIIN